jgi:hypothetical protein
MTAKSCKPRTVALVLTEHFQQRWNQRLQGSGVVPAAGTYIRLVQMQDKLRNRKIWVVKIRKGALLIRWSGTKKLMVMTVLTTEILQRLQYRAVSRFQPLTTVCLQIEQVYISQGKKKVVFPCEHDSKNSRDQRRRIDKW